MADAAGNQARVRLALDARRARCAQLARAGLLPDAAVRRQGARSPIAEPAPATTSATAGSRSSSQQPRRATSTRRRSSRRASTAASPACVWHRLMLDACIPPERRSASRAGRRDDRDELDDAPMAAGACRSSTARHGSRAAVRPRPDPIADYGDVGAALPARARPLPAAPAGADAATGAPRRGCARCAPTTRGSPTSSEYLPAVYREDPESASFLDRFLANLEGIAHRARGPHRRRRRCCSTRAPRRPRPSTGSLGWFDVALDPAWDEAARRLFIRHAMDFFRWRGTIRGHRARAAARARPLRRRAALRRAETDPAAAAADRRALSGPVARPAWSPRRPDRARRPARIAPSRARWRAGDGGDELHLRYARGGRPRGRGRRVPARRASRRRARWRRFAARRARLRPRGRPSEPDALDALPRATATAASSALDAAYGLPAGRGARASRRAVSRPSCPPTAAAPRLVPVRGGRAADAPQRAPLHASCSGPAGRRRRGAPGARTSERASSRAGGRAAEAGAHDVRRPVLLGRVPRRRGAARRGHAARPRQPRPARFVRPRCSAASTSARRYLGGAPARDGRHGGRRSLGRRLCDDDDATREETA